MYYDIYSKKQITALDKVLAEISKLPKKDASKVNGDCDKMKAYVNKTSLKVRNESS